MRITALYDIHGNLPALDAVLAEVDEAGCDLVLVGGDVALGPLPRQTLDRLASLGGRARFLRGNCDREMVESLAREPDPAVPWQAAVRWAAERLTDAQREMLAGLPLALEFEIDGLGPVHFCHGSPRRDDESVTRQTSDERLAAMAEGVAPRVVACGHTHVTFDREAGGRRWINPGSVGMPFDGEPGAYWALFGPGVTLRRTPYDLERARAAFLASGYPRAEEFLRAVARA